MFGAIAPDIFVFEINVTNDKNIQQSMTSMHYFLIKIQITNRF